MKVFIFAALLALTYAQAPLSCEQQALTCKKDALSNLDLKKLWECVTEYGKCKRLPPLDCLKECYTTLKACRAAKPGILDKAQCWVDSLQCTKNCRPTTNDEIFFDDINIDDINFDDEEDSGDVTCSDSYKTCRDQAVLNADLKGIFTCGKEYIKCRAAPAIECAKTCSEDLSLCKKTAASNFLNHAQCLIDFGKCSLGCKFAPSDEIADEMMVKDDAQLVYDAILNVTCKNKYIECRNNATMAGDLKAILKCGTDYLKCRAGPAANCVSQCGKELSDCRKASSNILDRAQCWSNATKCAAKCRLAPHNDIVESDDIELVYDDADDKTCKSKYEECRNNAVNAADLKSMFKCGTDYVKCRAGPAIQCASQCRKTFSDCRKAFPNFLDKAQCWVDAAKCAAKCRLAPHNDIVESDDTELVYDGADDKTCDEKYAACRDDAFKTKNIKAMFGCGTALAKCKAEPIVNCVLQCRKTSRDCRRAFPSLLDKAQCLVDAAKCVYGCKNAASDDVYIEDAVSQMADDVVIEDEADQSCADVYNECRKTSDIGTCAKAYISCRGGPLATCGAKCVAEWSVCRKDAGIIERAKCGLSLGQCMTTCRLAPHNDSN